MRKRSREDLEAENKRLSAENTNLQRGVQALVNKSVVWYATKKEKSGDGKYRFGVAYLKYNALLFITFIREGQKDHTAVYDLEQYIEGPFKLDRAAFTEWYKLAFEEVYKAERMWREYEKVEAEKGQVPA